MALDNLSPTVVLELDGKFASDVVDYVVDLSASLPDGQSASDVEIVLDAGNGESPVGLTVTDAEVFAPASGGLNTSTRFRLSGGTAGVRYRGQINFDLDSSPTVLRKKLFYVVIS